MDYIRAYQKSLKKTASRSHIADLVGDIILLNSGIIVTAVKERWQQGESVNGGIIGTYSWADYKLYKQSINPLAGGNVDLMLTGDLAEGLTIRRVSKAEYQIFSSDGKYDKIGKQYGYDEFGVDPERLDDIFEQLYQFAIETLLNELWQ